MINFYVYIFLEICLHLHAMKGAQLMSTHSALGFKASFHWAVPCFILIRSIHVILWGHKYWFPQCFSLWHFSLCYVSVTENNYYHILWNDRLVLISHFTSILRFSKYPWILDAQIISLWLSIPDILLCRKTQSMAGTKKKLWHSRDYDPLSLWRHSVALVITLPIFLSLFLRLFSHHLPPLATHKEDSYRHLSSPFHT